MAFVKSLVLLVATLLAVEPHTIAKRATFDLGQFFGTAVQSRAAAQNIVISGATEIVSRVNNASATIQGYVQAAKDIQLKVHAEATNQIASILTNAQLAASTQRGDQACVTKTIGDVEALAAKTLLDVVDCLLDKVTAIEDLLGSVIATGDSAITLVPVAVIALDDCQRAGGLFENACEAAVTMKFVGQLNAVVGGFAKSVTTATSLYAGASVDLATCAMSKIGMMVPEVGRLVTGFTMCQVVAKMG